MEVNTSVELFRTFPLRPTPSADTPHSALNRKSGIDRWGDPYSEAMMPKPSDDQRMSDGADDGGRLVLAAIIGYIIGVVIAFAIAS